MSKKSKNPSWTVMVAEIGVRERVSREAPDAVVLLDFLAKHVKPYKEVGWTSFSDWVLEADRRGLLDRKRPAEVPFVSAHRLLDTVFPPRLPPSKR